MEWNSNICNILLILYISWLLLLQMKSTFYILYYMIYTYWRLCCISVCIDISSMSKHVLTLSLLFHTLSKMGKKLKMPQDFWIDFSTLYLNVILLHWYFSSTYKGSLKRFFQTPVLYYIFYSCTRNNTEYWTNTGTNTWTKNIWSIFQR